MSDVPKGIQKAAKRTARLKARLDRIEFLLARATEAGDKERVAALKEEAEMRGAEYKFMALKLKAHAKDYPELAE